MAMAADRDYVVLLHGLGRTHLSMAFPRLRLRYAGFEVVSIQYPSRRKPIPELARMVGADLQRRIADRRKRVHFLTHSLGGIVLRTLLSQERPAMRLGRVVMLAPPNQGSHLAERFANNPLFRATMGPAGRQLGAGPTDLPSQLGPADFEVGVIAGNKAASPWAFLMSRESDGTVSIDEAAVEGMADFLIVPRGHTFIMNDPAVIAQAIHFFRNGRFARSNDRSEAAT